MAPKSSFKKKKDPITPSTSTKQPQPHINWPTFSPLLPSQDLALHHRLPTQIITIPRLFTSTLCKSYVSFLSTLPLTTTPGKPKKGDAVRVNDRFQTDDPAFAERLWSETGLKYLISTGEGSGMSDEERRHLWGGEVLGLNPNIRIYRYTPGQFFDQHYDESNSLLFHGPTGPVPAKTTWTLLLYLTSPATGCEGGETVFYPDASSKKAAAPEPVIVGLEVGMALLHKHGKDCMLHEGREVTKGEKWVIRSDLCVRR
jgi:hypothetical protein